MNYLSFKSLTLKYEFHIIINFIKLASLLMIILIYNSFQACDLIFHGVKSFIN